MANLFSSAVVLVATSVNDSGESRPPEADAWTPASTSATATFPHALA